MRGAGTEAQLQAQGLHLGLVQLVVQGIGIHVSWRLPGWVSLSPTQTWNLLLLLQLEVCKANHLPPDGSPPFAPLRPNHKPRALG